MAYEAFVVEIRQGRDGGLVVSVTRSPAGQGQAPFHPPFDAVELGQLGLDPRRVPARNRRLPTGAGNTLSLAAAGDNLFRALFHGAVRHRFERSLGLIESTGPSLCIQIK